MTYLAEAGVSLERALRVCCASISETFNFSQAFGTQFIFKQNICRPAASQFPFPYQPNPVEQQAWECAHRV